MPRRAGWRYNTRFCYRLRVKIHVDASAHNDRRRLIVCRYSPTFCLMFLRHRYAQCRWRTFCTRSERGVPESVRACRSAVLRPVLSLRAVPPRHDVFMAQRALLYAGDVDAGSVLPRRVRSTSMPPHVARIVRVVVGSKRRAARPIRRNAVRAWLPAACAFQRRRESRGRQFCRAPPDMPPATTMSGSASLYSARNVRALR